VKDSQNKVGYLGGNSILGLENLKDCQPTPVKLHSGKLARCPSVRGYYQNTFEVKCPFNLEWTVKKDKNGNIIQWDINPDNTSIDLSEDVFIYEQGLKILGFEDEGKSVQILIHPEWSFVSDTPNTIMLQHSNGIDTNPHIISGQIDIYKWPDRQLSVGYNLEDIRDEQTFTLKQGEPWYRVSFFAPDLKPIKLVKMEERPEFLKRTQNKSSLTGLKNLNWKKIFADFGDSRPQKLIP